MNKFAVHKGKEGLDFRTLADTEHGAQDLAWEQAKTDEALSTTRGPFTWWNLKSKQYGQDKWYVRELVINDAIKVGEKSNV